MAAPATAEPRQPPADGVGVYRPRRPRASSLYRLLERHFRELCLVWDERFAPTSGDWRGVIPKVVDQFLACGLLEHGFARIRCDTCAPEHLLAFSCKCRYFCASCHAKRLARWSLWLDETLLAPVPHRQVVLTLPKRLRAYCLYRRALLGDLARVAARTVTAAVRATTGEADLRVGIVACLQTHGSLANWHPHLHLVVTDGGFRPDGTFVRWPGWPSHDTASLTEAFRRAVLRLLVRRGLFDEDQAQGMLQWPHSGFHVHAGVGVPQDDRACALRLARYCARNPVALERMTDPTIEQVTYRSRQGRGAHRRHRAGGSAGVSRPPGDPHPRARPGDAALLRLVRQPDPGQAAASGAGTLRGRGGHYHCGAERLVPPGGPVPLG